MKNFLKQIAFKFARSKPGGWMIWFILRYFPFIIPFKKLYQDPFLIAIPHPVPSYATHILLLPRVYMPDFLALDIQSETGNNYVQSAQKALNVLLADMEQTDIQLVINGGDFQDFKLLHMHLIENETEINNSERLELEDQYIELSNLILQIQQKIQNTKYCAYRILLFFNGNDKIRLQIGEYFHLKICKLVIK